MRLYSVEIVIEQEPGDEGCAAHSPTLPGSVSSGKTIEEAKGKHEGRQLAITRPIHVSWSERVQSGSESSGRSTNTPCPSVAVVMLHWGPEEVTKRCLQSLGRIAYPAASVILIDNTDTLSPSVTGWAHPLPLDLVRPGRNLGFAEGCAVGMSIALERGADYVLLLNNDVVVDPPFLDRLVAAASACPEAGLICPQIEFLEARGRVWFGGGDFSLWSGIPRHAHWRKPATRDHVPRESDFATGCAMLVDPSVIRTVATFDPRFFAYGEDLDLSLRARQARFGCSATTATPGRSARPRGGGLHQKTLRREAVCSRVGSALIP